MLEGQKSTLRIPRSCLSCQKKALAMSRCMCGNHLHGPDLLWAKCARRASEVAVQGLTVS